MIVAGQKFIRRVLRDRIMVPKIIVVPLQLYLQPGTGFFVQLYWLQLWTAQSHEANEFDSA
jgi:hypothetical protein